MNVYTALSDYHQRPEPFSIYTTDVLWTEPHLSQQMLHYHLNQDTDLASRPLSAIDTVVDWVDEKFNLNGKRVCDLGCGPACMPIGLPSVERVSMDWISLPIQSPMHKK